MRIVAAKTIQIAIPLDAPVRWAFGVRTQVTRTIVRVQFDNGIEGIGETVGGDTVNGILALAARTIAGETAFDLERIFAKLKMHSYFSGYAGLAAVCGLEMACWDAIGKLTGRPVYDFLGGLWEREIEFSGYLFFRYRDEKTGKGGESDAAGLVQQAVELRGAHGFSAFNLKGGVYPPEIEVGVLRTLREHFGEQVRLRIDPQGNWSYETALRWWPRLRDIGIEFLEDPVWGMDMMARLRREISVPFATNMWVCDFETLQSAVRMMPADIILADPHRWGGILACKKLAAVAEIMGLSISLHSASELGISTAACLHLAASTPVMRLALHTHYPYQVDDVITTPFRFKDGKLAVPEGPGLGVTLDEKKLEHYAELYLAQARTSAPAHVRDPMRPDYVPRAF